MLRWKLCEVGTPKRVAVCIVNEHGNEVTRVMRHHRAVTLLRTRCNKQQPEGERALPQSSSSEKDNGEAPRRRWLAQTARRDLARSCRTRTPVIGGLSCDLRS